MDSFWHAFSSFIGAILGVWIGSYIHKKGENLATKQDITEITGKIESVKASIGSQLYIHQYRYQNEYRLLLKMAKYIANLKFAAAPLVSMWKHIPQASSQETLKSSELSNLEKEIKILGKFAERNKAFFPENIFKSIEALSKFMYELGIKYKFGSPEYWKSIPEGIETIQSLSEDIIKSIRDRIKSWEVFDGSSK